MTWSPFKSGKTTVRAGGGIFYDWLEADVYEQTLRVDGVRQQDLVVRIPGYPDPFDGGFSERAADQQVPAGRRAGDADAATWSNLGISQQLTPTVGLNVNMMHMTG